MSLLSQLDAFIADGTIAKADKPRKKGKPKAKINPNTAKKYIRAGHRLAGERHGFQAMKREQKSPAIPTPVFYEDKCQIVGDKLEPIHPPTYFEEHGHKSALILSPDDISALKDTCHNMQKELIDRLEAGSMIKFILNHALRVDGKELVILSSKKDED